MSRRLYIGNLDRNVCEEDIKNLFSEKGLSVENILLKSGYAFVDCQDQSTVDSAIDKLSGLKLMDKEVAVEPAVSKSSSARTKLSIRNVPEQMTDESVRATFSQYGNIKDLHRKGEALFVTYSTADEALEAKEKLQDVELEGQKLKVDFMQKRHNQQRPVFMPMPKQEFPLRLLVPPQHVGAIIGRSGQTIRNITQQTNARVDVIRRDNSMHEDKVVLIMGSETQNCIDACLEILKVMNADTQSDVAPREVELRILAHNNLCGRLIGKQGVIIKAMMEETETVLTVSSANSVGPMNTDRIVTIKGGLEQVCAAASKVYDKLKACNDADTQNPRYMPMGQGAMPQMPIQPWQMHPPFTHAYGGPRGGAIPPMYPPHMNGPPQSTIGGHMTCFLYIPKASVGAVIGSKGSFINHVKQESRASCQVQEGLPGESESNERPVKITGYPDCVWKAQWFIFEKVKVEGFAGYDYARLRCDILVPRKMVGRIIGKGGRNVRYIQDITDASIKLPDEQNPDVEEVAVEVNGNIYSQTLAQALIRQLIVQGQFGSPEFMNRGPRGLPAGPNRYHQIADGPPRQAPQRSDNQASNSTE
ncbi:insulin-like growth factor 2 mRNA-binding protein 1 [Watersipora subatra]|uniref:insulin-like growth factor 2 mRNA-binding protein 1 n=1 Tax=Watersipora subatra TaxID=2589382 RepID=UPI00355AE825